MFNKKADLLKLFRELSSLKDIYPCCVYNITRSEIYFW